MWQHQPLGGTLLQGGGCVVTAKAAYDPLLLALSILCSALLYSAVMLGLSKVICVGQGEITEVWEYTEGIAKSLECFLIVTVTSRVSCTACTQPEGTGCQILQGQGQGRLWFFTAKQEPGAWPQSLQHRQLHFPWAEQRSFWEISRYHLSDVELQLWNLKTNLHHHLISCQFFSIIVHSFVLYTPTASIRFFAPPWLLHQLIHSAGCTCHPPCDTQTTAFAVRFRIIELLKLEKIIQYNHHHHAH